MTHERFIHAVRDLTLAAQPDSVREKLAPVKLVYGAGSGAYRGICFYSAWENGHQTDFLEVAASGEESPVQLAGTTIHELAHVLAGTEAGHGPLWKDCCKALGLRAVRAAGTVYHWSNFSPALRLAIAALPAPTDGAPKFASATIGPLVALPLHLRPCPMGIGTRGGKSRGKGSGSRLRLWQCQCPKPVKVRVASDTFAATCKTCGRDFVRVSPKETAPV